jgi:putative hemolysin
VDGQIPFRFPSVLKTEWMNEGEHEFDTLAGFILHQLERIPRRRKFTWKDLLKSLIWMDTIDKVYWIPMVLVKMNNG